MRYLGSGLFRNRPPFKGKASKGNMIQSRQMGGRNSERQENLIPEFEDPRYCGSGYRVLVICNDGAYFLRHRLLVVTHLTSIGVDVTVIAGGDPIPAERIRGWKYIHALRYDLCPHIHCAHQ